MTSYTEGFSHFVTSMTAPVASGWSVSPGGAFTHWKAPPFTARALQRTLQEFLGDKLFGESTLRHVIPAFDGRFSEVFLFKTRHHDDYKQDWRMKLTDVAMATSAASTIYRASPTGGYMLIDGGVWANNPMLLAVTEAMICYDVPRERIKVLSIGCGDDPYYVTRRMIGGGLWQWRKVIGGAMRAVAGRHQPSKTTAWASQCRQDRAVTYRRSDRDRRLPAGGERAIAGSQRCRDVQPRRVQAMLLARRSDRFTPVPWPLVANVPQGENVELINPEVRSSMGSAEAARLPAVVNS